MKKLLIPILIFLVSSSLYSQEDGGNLCHRGDVKEPPVWILRFNIIDKETHNPIRYANVEIFAKNRGDGQRWHSNREGVAVMVALHYNCIPNSGTLEITAPGYKYFSQPIYQDEFRMEAKDKRIFLEGHRHNWTDLNQFPSTQELIDKISARRYEVGVKMINVGYNTVNYAPACFEYEIEMEKIDRRNGQDPNNDPNMPNDEVSLNERINYWQFDSDKDNIGDYRIEINDDENVKISKSADQISISLPITVMKDDCHDVTSNEIIELGGTTYNNKISASGDYQVVIKDCLGGVIDYEQISVNIKFEGNISDEMISGLLECHSYYKGVQGTKINYEDGTDHDLDFINIYIHFN